jgi:TPR repeat protein
MKKTLLSTILLILVSISLGATVLEKSKKVCSEGNATICTALGLAYQKGLKGVNVNLSTARYYLTEACNLNSGFGCYALGLLYIKDNNIEQNMIKGVDILNKSCKIGYTKGCKHFKAMKKALIADYNDACDKGNMDACYALGILYFRDANPDHYKAIEYYTKACEGGNIQACNDLGTNIVQGIGTFKDYGKAIKLFEKVCKNNIGAGCHNLGLMYKNGLGMLFKNTNKSEK